MLVIELEGDLVSRAATLPALLAPLIAPYPYDKVNFGQITKPPSAQHWLGTDSLGRDVLSRLMYGARVSLSVSPPDTGITGVRPRRPHVLTFGGRSV